MTLARLASLLAAVSAAALLMSASQADDSRYMLYAAEQGEGMVLTVQQGGEKDGLVYLAPSTGANTQMFYSEDTPQGRRIHSDAGDGSMCLDVVNGGAFDRYLRVAPCGDYSGQIWSTEPRMAGNGFLNYSNGFTGAKMSMQAIYGGRDHNGVVMMPRDNFSKRQDWQPFY